MFESFSTLSGTMQTAIVSGITAAVVSGLFLVFATFLKDFLAPTIVRRIESKRSSTEVFRRYAEPLAAVSMALFWRLRETLAGDGRGFYLAAVEPRSEFERYKLFSTYYRTAAMLGCIRALQQELLYFRVEQQRVESIEQALLDFETALADGHEVELQRLRGLLTLWNATLVQPTEEVHVAVDIERIKRTWMSQRRETAGEQLGLKDQKTLLKIIASALEPNVNTTIPQNIQDATCAQAIRWLFIKQAWIYRDWQSSIGDMMLKTAQTGNRNFEIIGFGDFEQMLMAPTVEQYLNLSRIACMFDGLNVEKLDPFDARSVIIRNVFKETAKLIEALSSTTYSKYLIPDHTLEEVKLITHPSSTPQ